jgi:hypothetical protein
MVAVGDTELVIFSKKEKSDEPQHLNTAMIDTVGVTFPSAVRGTALVPR